LGDYTTSTFDPSNETDFWTYQEIATNYVGTLTNGSGRWATWWANLVMPIPANDNFTNAIALGDSIGTTNGTTVRASRETGEPNHAGNTNSPSVWYKWTAPTNGSASLNVANVLGNNLDTILAVYTGTNVSGLTLVTNSHGGSSGSKVVFTASGGTTYRIAVAGFNGSFGDFSLDWVQPSSPMFTLQPRGFDVVAGTNVTFTAAAIGIPDPAYQWTFNGTNVSGATSSSYTKSNVQTNDTGNCTVVATNSSGAVTSSVAHLQVYVSATPLLSYPSYFSNQFRMVVSGVTGAQYVVEASTN